MIVNVKNRRDARRWSFENHDGISTIIISITDTFSQPNTFDHNDCIKAVLPLQFDDVNRGQPNCITSEDAKKIVDFVNLWKDKVDRILVHCEAGQSRSAGVAAAICKYLKGDDSEIYDNPRYTPNSTCYSMVLENFYA